MFKYKKQLNAFMASMLAISMQASQALAFVELQPSSKLLGNDTAASDQFGSAVSVDGNYAIVGSSLNDDGGSEAGSAYIYENIAGTWTEIVEIQATAPTAGDQFGFSVSISGDTAIVGAPMATSGGVSNVGKAYIFQKDQGGADNWGLVKEIESSDPEESAQFGYSVAIDGDYVAIGAPKYDRLNRVDSGTVVIHERNLDGTDAWGYRTFLKPFATIAGDEFGASLDFDMANERIVVGAIGDVQGEGAILIFEKDYDTENAWKPVTILTGLEGDFGDEFGHDVSIDNLTVVAGSSKTGEVTIFDKDVSASVWRRSAVITKLDADLFGVSVAVKGDVVMAGAMQDDEGGLVANENEGIVYELHRDLGGSGQWGVYARYADTLSGANALLGSNIAYDGTTLVAGAPGDNANGLEAGAAYFFEPSTFTPPTSPTGFTNDSKGSEEALISWTDNSGNEDGFNIYYGTENKFYPETLNKITVPANTTSYFLEGLVQNTFHFFWVTAFNTEGESYPGDSTSFKTTTNQTLSDYLVPDLTTTGDLAGHQVDIENGFAVVTAPYEDGTGTDVGAAYIYKRGSEGWRQIKRIVGSTATSNDRFGTYAAMTDDLIIVATGQNKKAYIYWIDQGGTENWGEVAVLDTSMVVSENISVEIDDQYAIIGDPEYGGTNEGAFHTYNVFEGGLGNWGYQYTARASSPEANGQMGQSVVISGDYAAVSDAEAGTEKVHVFKRSGTAWNEVDVLSEATCTAGEGFGTKVDMDGDYLAINCPGGNEVFVYQRDAGLDTWTKMQSWSDTSPDVELGIGLAIQGSLLYFSYGLTTISSPQGPTVNEVREYYLDPATNFWINTKKLTPYAQNHGGNPPGNGFFNNNFGHVIGTSSTEMIIGSDSVTSGGMAWGYHIFKPQPAVDFSASVLTASSIQLDWTDFATNEFGYIIYRNTVDDFDTATQIDSLSFDTITYVDSSVTTNVTYYYWLVTENGSGEGTSREATITLEDPTRPSNLAISQISTTSFTVQWSDNANTETGYNVYLNTADSIPGAPTATVGANQTSYEFTGLTTGQTYYVWVEAYNASSSTLASSNISAVPSASLPPTNYSSKNVPTVAGFNNIGQQVAVGDNFAAAADSAGKVAIYRVDATNQAWQQVGDFTASNPVTGMSISGEYLALGQSSDTASTGMVEIYKIDNANETNTLVDTLTAATPASTELFGASVALDGDYLAVSVPGVNFGEIEIFKRDTGADTWSLIDTVTTSDGTTDDQLGEQALSMNNGKIAVSIADAPTQTGAVYIFEQATTEDWSQAAKLLPAGVTAGDKYGTYGLAIEGDYVFVGYSNVAGGGTDTGKVDIYKSDGAGAYNLVSSIVQEDAENNRFFGVDDIKTSIQASGTYFAVNFEFTSAGNTYDYTDLYQKDNGAETWTHVYRLVPDSSKWWCWLSPSGPASQTCTSYESGALGLSDNFVMYGAPFDSENDQEEGAVWFYNHVPLAGSSNSGILGDLSQCLERPTQINLSEPLDVVFVGDKPEVVLKWGTVDDRTNDLSEKIRLFREYLSKNPKMGESEFGLANVFTTHVYDELSNSRNRQTREAFLNALAGTVADSTILAEKNINNLFTDYYPYIFLHELRRNPELGEKFVEGLRVAIEGKNTVQMSEVIASVVESLKTISSKVEVGKTAACMSAAASDFDLNDFIPGQNTRVYGLQSSEIQRLVEAIKQDGEAASIINSISNDRGLINATQDALDSGVSSVLNRWSDNSNIQSLIRFYEQDPKMRNLVNTFFESSIGKKFDDCARNNYKKELFNVTKAVHLDLIQPILDRNEICSDAAVEPIFTAMWRTIAPSRPEAIKQEAANVVSGFIDDYLSLESQVSRYSRGETPFTDFYTRKLSRNFNFVDSMKIEIHRDDELIHVMDNNNATQFIDRSLPENTSGRVQNYEYKIVTSTACEIKTGQSSVAQVNPVLSKDTKVDIRADVEIRLRDSDSEEFMTRLQTLFQGLLEGKLETEEIEGGTFNDSEMCIESKENLLEAQNGEALLDYVVACFGGQGIDETLKTQSRDIISPLLRLLEFNDFMEVDDISERFLDPIIQGVSKEFKSRQNIVNAVKPLARRALRLLKVAQIEDFTQEERELIKCGGYASCSVNAQEAILDYFDGVSHAEEITIQVYDESGKFIMQKDAETDIFGQITDLDLGELQGNSNYEFKIRLKNEPYALPKISRIRISDVTPQRDGQFISYIKLESSEPFVFGNFDNSDDEITLDDIDAWARLIQEDPEKWSQANVDGLTGIDLFDVNLLQSNWGSQITGEIEEDEEELTTSELVQVFGGSSGGQANEVYAPKWLRRVQDHQACSAQ